jgi:hypothetical protein
LTFSGNENNGKSLFETSSHFLWKPNDNKIRPTFSFGPNYKTTYGFFGELPSWIESKTKHGIFGIEIRYSINLQTIL